MLVDAAHPRRCRPPAGLLTIVRDIPASAVLTALVVASAALRLVAGLERATPRYFPDEYLYSQLARSLAHDGTTRVLGTNVHLPSLLEPAVAAVAWLPGDPLLAFRLTQALHAAAMSLAALPVYALARALSLRRRWALGAAALAVASPDLLYSGYVTADALGYPLGLLAVLVGVRMLSAPSVRAQSAFLAAVALAASARLEYAIVAPTAAVAALVVERGHVARSLRRFALLYGAMVVSASAALAFGHGALGRYDVAARLALPGDALAWLAPTTFLLALACGVAVVPGAAAWVASQVVRPTSRERLAFAALAGTLVVALVALTAVFTVESRSDRFIERYLIVVVPLAALAFAAWLDDRVPGRRVAIGVAIALVAATPRLPLSQYAAGQGRADSPILLGLGSLERVLGVGSASLVAALVVSLTAILGAGAAWWRPARAVALAVSAALLSIVSLAAHTEDIHLSRVAAARYGGTPPNWVDASGVRAALLVQTTGSGAPAAMTQLFWNASVSRAALLGEDADPLDGVSETLHVSEDGTLRLSGRTVHVPLLVATGGTRTVFLGARTVARAPAFVLVRPAGAGRLAALAEGLAADGWLASSGHLTVYAPRNADLCRTATLDLSLPAGLQPVAIDLHEESRQQHVTVGPAHDVAIVLHAGAGRMQSLSFEAQHPRLLTNPIRAVAARAMLHVADRACSVGSWRFDRDSSASPNDPHAIAQPGP